MIGAGQGGALPLEKRGCWAWQLLGLHHLLKTLPLPEPVRAAALAALQAEYLSAEQLLGGAVSDAELADIGVPAEARDAVAAARGQAGLVSSASPCGS